VQGKKLKLTKNGSTKRARANTHTHTHKEAPKTA